MYFKYPYIASYQTDRQVGVVSAVRCEVLSVSLSLCVYCEDHEKMFNTWPLISIHIIPEESQYVVDVMRCMYKKGITDDILWTKRVKLYCSYFA